MIVYLKCANNNRAETVMQSFLEAVNTFGLLSWVRADRGGENVQVADFMDLQHGTDRRSFLSGRSIHNQRIERLWRDVFSACLILYYNLFNYMENIGILDVDNDLHLFALHYVFIARINSSLIQFKNAWNNHPLSSVSHLSPYQLWISGEQTQVIMNCLYLFILYTGTRLSSISYGY